MKFFLAGISLICFLLSFVNKAEALYLCNTPGTCDFMVGYKATDLPDITPGEDLWKYDYTFLNTTHVDTFLSDGTPTSISDALHVGDTLSLVFEHSDGLIDPPFYYMNIQPFANTDWGFSLVNGGVDLGFPNKVIWYNPLVDNPSLAGLGATFIWNHSGTPGSQQFAFWDTDSPTYTYDLYNDTKAVPEPSTMLLLGSGLAGLGLVRRKFTK